MQTYLNNLLPRVRQYSQTLDKKELLVDQPWVLIDANGDKQQYIFERDGKLIMALNGKVQYGTWKYIPAARSLLIDRAPNDSLLLNHDFFAAGVCILKKDGFVDDPWMLVNERIVPDHDIQRYLWSLLPENRNLKEWQVKGATLRYQANDSAGVTIGTTVVDAQYEKVTGTFRAADRRLFYEIKEGRVLRIFKKVNVETDRGQLVLEIRQYYNLEVGSPAYHLNGDPAEGDYKLKDNQDYKMITAWGGKVTSIKVRHDLLNFFLWMIGFIIVIAILIALTEK